MLLFLLVFMVSFVSSFEQSEEEMIEENVLVINIKKISFDNKKLNLAASNFQIQKNKIGKAGRINVQVFIKDEKNKIIFDKRKILITEKKLTTISIGFGWLKEGKYNIVVNVTDLLTGNTDMNFIQPRVY